VPTLRELQKVVGESILMGDPSAATDHIVDDAIPAAERLCIYRNTFIGTLIGALRLTYPAVERLVGPDFFEGSASSFIDRHPPKTAYLNEYGAEFGAFLADFPPAASLPYLRDVAALEWAVSCAACAPDVPVLDPASLAHLDEADHGRLRFITHPSVTLLEIHHPADLIWRAVLDRDDDVLAALHLELKPLWLLVHRGAEGVVVRRLTVEEGRFTAALCAGQALAEAMPSDAPPDLVALLADHFAQGRFTGIAMVETATRTQSHPMESLK
jgi:hypothetical protein